MAVAKALPETWAREDHVFEREILNTDQELWFVVDRRLHENQAFKVRHNGDLVRIHAYLDQLTKAYTRSATFGAGPNDSVFVIFFYVLNDPDAQAGQIR